MTDDLDLAALERWATGSDDTIYLLTREDATALLARLRAAEAVIDRYRRDVGQLVEERTAAEARIAALTAAGRAVAVFAQRPTGHDWSICTSGNAGSDGRCTCGYEASMAALEAALDGAAVPE